MDEDAKQVNLLARLCDPNGMGMKVYDIRRI